MGDSPLPPFVSWYTDRHGRRRHRYRKPGQQSRDLPGAPGSDEFEAALDAAWAGEPRPGRSVGDTRRPSAVPRSIAAAWDQVLASVEWKQLKPISQDQQRRVAVRFLAMPIAEGETETFGRMPFSGFRRGHVKAILGRYARPHAAEAVLRLLRKLSLAALDLEWIENDPTHRVKFRPKLKGHRAWTDAEHAQYEARWPSGTRQRRAYALALYTGQRRGDVAAMQCTAIVDGLIAVAQQEKTGAPAFIPIHPALQVEIDVIARHNSPYLLTGAHADRYTAPSFGNNMADWIEAAGLPAECKLHGLRKSAGRCLAEAGATTRQIMAILGHKTIKEAERYTREASQKQLARDGMEHWTKPKLAVVK